MSIEIPEVDDGEDCFDPFLVRVERQFAHVQPRVLAEALLAEIERRDNNNDGLLAEWLYDWVYDRRDTVLVRGIVEVREQRRAASVRPAAPVAQRAPDRIPPASDELPALRLSHPFRSLVDRLEAGEALTPDRILDHRYMLGSGVDVAFRQLTGEQAVEVADLLERRAKLATRESRLLRAVAALVQPGQHVRDVVTAHQLHETVQRLMETARAPIDAPARP